MGKVTTSDPLLGRQSTWIAEKGPDLKMVNPHAVAIDIGSTMHMAAVNPGATDMPVRAFGTFTRDLHDLADWFRSCGVTSVVMDSTGVSWFCKLRRCCSRIWAKNTISPRSRLLIGRTRQARTPLVQRRRTNAQI